MGLPSLISKTTLLEIRFQRRDLLFCFNNMYYHLGDPGVDGRIMLGRIFKKWDVGVRTGLGWLRKGTGGGRL
jgi:hypothetical protein